MQVLRPARVAVAVAVSSVTLAAVAACGGGGGSKPSPTQAPPRPRIGTHAGLVACGTRSDDLVPRPSSGLFSRDSVWNRPLSSEAGPGDQALANQLADEARREIHKGIGPWIQTTSYSTPLYSVGSRQRCVRVRLDVSQAYGSTLKRAFLRVPLPRRAEPAKGTDHHLTVWQPATDSLWEFWKLRRGPDGWHAAWGGAMHHVSRNPGYYTTGSWPGARAYWGATATSLPAIAGTITAAELERGRIDHALAISVPNARAGVFAPPAQRTDGTSHAQTAIPEGTRFRLDPKLDIASLHLPPVVKTIAIAAQRYGMIVRDKTLTAIGFYAEDPAPLGDNPYPKLFGGKYPSVLLARFPWSHVQALPVRLRDASG